MPLGDANEARHVLTDDDVNESWFGVANPNAQPLTSPTETAATPQIIRRSILAPPLCGAPLASLFYDLSRDPLFPREQCRRSRWVNRYPATRQLCTG